MVDKPRITIIGPNDEPTKSFMTQLVELLNSVTQYNGTQHCPVSIDTKYYTAEVLIELHPATPSSDALKETQAVVALCCTAESRSKLIEVEVETQLCVVSDSITEDETKEVVDWCVEHGWEVVEINKKGTLTEKEGIERIVEALQTTMWTNMQLKNDSDATQNEVTIEPTGVTLPDASKQDSCLAKEEEEDLKEPQAEHDTTDMELNNSLLCGDEELDESDVLFELAETVKQVRMQGKTMADDERRQLAADSAIEIMKRLGLE